MIYITCGTCGTSQGYKTSADGALSLPACEEARLVSRGVAEYVTRPVTGEDPDALPEPLPSGNEPQDIQEAGGAEPPADGDEEPDSGDEAAQLERMTKAELEQMARDLGLDISTARTKRDLAALIAAADAPEADGAEGL